MNSDAAPSVTMQCKSILTSTDFLIISPPQVSMSATSFINLTWMNPFARSPIFQESESFPTFTNSSKILLWHANLAASSSPYLARMNSSAKSPTNKSESSSASTNTTPSSSPSTYMVASSPFYLARMKSYASSPIISKFVSSPTPTNTSCSPLQANVVATSSPTSNSFVTRMNSFAKSPTNKFVTSPTSTNISPASSNSNTSMGASSFTSLLTRMNSPASSLVTLV